MRRRLHEAAKLAFSFVMLPIRGGPLAGKRWIVTSGSRFLVGDYEPEKSGAIRAHVKPGDVVFDIGAHVGYFTVLMSERAGPGGRIFAFEPRPLNQRFLARHLRVNGCTNVEVFPTSVGDREGPARLDTSTGTGTGRISPTGQVPVQMLTIDGLVESGRLPPPDFVKIDVEGGEMDVLRGARETLERYRPLMVLATHGDEIDAECHAFLEELDYSLEDLGQVKGDVEYLVTPRHGTDAPLGR